MYNKKLLSTVLKDLEKAKRPAQKKNIDYNSKMGYRDDSPFRKKPKMDIYTGDGTIDMSNTGIDILANGRYLPKYSGLHQFDTNVVTEIPLEQAKKGGAKSFSSNLQATNRIFKKNKLFKKNPLFKPNKLFKKKNYKSKTYDPMSMYFQDGGSIETELTQEEIQAYRDGGYIVEEITDPSIPTLTRAQDGGQIYIYPGRKNTYYKKDSQGNWLIKSKDTGWKYKPITDPDGKRAKLLDANARPFQQKTTNTSSKGSLTQATPMPMGNALFDPNITARLDQERAQKKAQQQSTIDIPKALVSDNTRTVVPDFAAEAVMNRPRVDEAVKRQEDLQREFEAGKWKEYEKQSFLDQMGDRAQAFMVDPLGMASRFVSGEQAYIPGMGRGLLDRESPEYQNYLRSIGYTPGEFEISDVQNMLNPMYWGASIGNNMYKGNYGTAALEGVATVLPIMPKGSLSPSNIKAGVNLLADDVSRAGEYLTTKKLPGSPNSLVTPEGFQNRVFDSNVQLGSFQGKGHLSEKGYTYRTLGDEEIEAIRNTQGVFPKAGKAKGGNENVKYWTKGNEKNWYADNPNQQVIRVKDSKFTNDKVVSADDVEVFNHSTGKFEPINKSKELPGSPNSKFQSEIDWGKWNPDTPKYPELINEYNAIEESTKKAGTWMKNPDGSLFQGTPEQFIQQQSSWFKKAFGDSKLVNPNGSPAFQYHGGKKGYEQFLTPQDKGYIKRDTYTGDQGIYFTPSKSRAKSYSRNTPKNEREIYQTYINMENPYSGRIKGTYGKDQITNEQYEELLKNNYDGIINKSLFPYSRQTITFDPKNIKSAIGNVGFFDMSNPNIYKAIIPTIGVVGLTGLLQEKDGGSIDMELTPEEIEAYKKRGYIIEDRNEFEDGGIVKKRKKKKQDTGINVETGQPAEISDAVEYRLPYENAPEGATEVLYQTYPVPVKEKAPDWAKFEKEYLNTKPIEDFLYDKKIQYLKRNKGLNKAYGQTLENFPSQVEQMFRDEYEYKKNNYITQRLGQKNKFKPSRRGEWVDELTDRERSIVANSKYESKLQPSVWSRTLSGARSVFNALPGPDITTQIPGLTKKENKEALTNWFEGAEVLAPFELPGTDIMNRVKNYNLSPNAQFKENPAIASGERRANVNDLDVMLPTLPLDIYGVGEIVANIPKATKFLKTNPKTWLSSEAGRLDNPNLFQDVTYGEKTSWTDPLSKFYKKRYDNQVADLQKRANALLEQYPGRQNSKIRFKKEQELWKEKDALDFEFLNKRIERSRLPIKPIMTESGTQLGGGQGQLFVNTSQPDEVIKIGTYPGTPESLNQLIETGKFLQGMPGIENVAFPTKALTIKPNMGLQKGSHISAQFMPWKGIKLDPKNPINKPFKGLYNPSKEAKQDLFSTAQLLEENNVGIDFSGNNNIIYDPRTKSYVLVDLNDLDKTSDAATFGYNKTDIPLKERIESVVGDIGDLSEAKTVQYVDPILRDYDKYKTLAMKGSSLTQKEADELLKRLPEENIEIIDQGTNADLGYSSLEETLLEQQKGFDFGTDVMERWAIRDPDKYYKNKEIIRAAEKERRNYQNNVFDQEHFDLHKKYAMEDGDYISSVVSSGSNQDEIYKTLDAYFKDKVSKDPDYARYRELEDVKNKTINDLDGYIQNLKKESEDLIDPDFKEKVKNLYQEAGVKQEGAASNFDSGLKTRIKDRSKLVYMNEDDPAFKSLSDKDKQYLRDQVKNLRGVRTQDATITLGSKPSSTYTLQYIPKGSTRSAEDFILTDTREEVLQSPQMVSSVQSHEVGHDLQNTYNRWIDLLQENNPDYGYYTGKDTNPIAKLFKEHMVEPKKVEAGSTKEYDYNTWLSGAGELHSELSKARAEMIKYLMETENLSMEDAIKTLKATERTGDDNLYKTYLTWDLEKHFKPNTPFEIKKQLLRYLPATIPAAIGTGMMQQEKDGGSVYLEVSSDDIDKYVQGGYVVEEID